MSINEEKVFITTHLVPNELSNIKIEVVDEKGIDKANHRYDITGFDTSSNQSAYDKQGYKSSFSRNIILFQNGPLKENESNGITIETLLAICADRLEGFQSGPYASIFNEVALHSINNALESLQQITKIRIGQNVKNTSQQHTE